MLNRDKSNNPSDSFQLIDLLEKEVYLMRELLSEYRAEELFLQREDPYSSNIAKNNQDKLKQQISQIRIKRLHSHLYSEEDFSVDILETQIRLLSREIVDKIALLKQMDLIPQKIKPKKGKKTILIAEEEESI
jgi:predicted HTH transcriptional regulator